MGISVFPPVIEFGGNQSSGGGVVPPTNQFGSNGQPQAPLSYSLQLPLPWLTPMPGAQQFNQEADVASAIVQTATLAGLDINVPQGYRCRVSSVSTYIDNMLITTNVTWSVLVNGAPAPVSGFQNLRMFPRSAPFVGNTFDAFLLISGPADITVQFTNGDGGTYQIGAALSGWIWNIALEAQWKNNGGQWAG